MNGSFSQSNAEEQGRAKDQDSDRLIDQDDPLRDSAKSIIDTI